MKLKRKPPQTKIEKEAIIEVMRKNLQENNILNKAKVNKITKTLKRPLGVFVLVIGFLKVLREIL
ncbi:hypothetical protein SDC9_193908 [bioreactor metagenome]|uniref:Uncharacterized protein n=1 Tax=bioreactor metagenome TaxID=1076179 RepID=A0A645I693_9ZZZZ